MENTLKIDADICNGCAMGLFKRGNIWWFKFMSKGQLIQRSTKSRDKKLAERIYWKIRSEIVEAHWFGMSVAVNKTVSELLDKFIKDYASYHKSSNTVKNDSSMSKEIKAFCGNTRLVDVTPSLISSYKDVCREKKLSPASINQRLTFLNKAFKLAIKEWEWCHINPIEKVSREKIRNERDRWLSLDEEKRLIEKSVLYPTIKGNKTEPRYWLQEVVVFALNTGMRQDEILSLQWTTVDLFRRTVTVMKSKNGEKRTIPLNRKAFDLLKRKSIRNHIGRDYVFTSETGTKISRRNLYRAFSKVVRRIKIDDFRFHDLRHTFATRLTQAGIDLYKISKLLGHKDLRTTQRYSHHWTESLRSGVEVLDKVDTDLDTTDKKGGC
ncbi:MAG: tyrosine-type recombinase/integrase [Thermodesulfobacteriota bacterium]|nr:MAG: tyrosine-type recombinase/integrase [Thermodesulfobacteriota bacterium]